MSRKRFSRLILCGLVALVVASFFAHPYTRQIVFGPTINGIPLWSWQQRFRQVATQPHDSAFAKAFDWLGFKATGPATWSDSPELLPVLLSLEDDADPRVRMSVAYHLASYPESAPGEALIRLLDDPEPRVRAVAAAAFTNRAESYAPALAKLREHMDDMGDGDGQTRVHSANGVYRIIRHRDEKVIRTLREGLQCTSPFARFHAVAGLCSMGKAVPELFDEVAELARNRGELRYSVAAHVGNFGPVAIPLLIDLLNDQEIDIRKHAAHSLGKIGLDARQALPALQRAAEDSSERVKEAARKALSQIDPDKFPGQ